MHTPKTKSKPSTHQTRRLCLVVLFLSNVLQGVGQEAWQMLHEPALLRRHSRLGQYWQKTFVDVFNKYSNIVRQQCLSNNLHNNAFLPGFSSSPGWLLVTPTRGAWWCRYRWHCRSGPRHLSPSFSSAHKNGFVKTSTHMSFPIHPCTLITQTKSKTLNSLDIWPFRSIPVQSGGGWLSESLADAPLECSTSKAFWPRTILTENICGCV